MAKLVLYPPPANWYEDLLLDLRQRRGDLQLRVGHRVYEGDIVRAAMLAGFVGYDGGLTDIGRRAADALLERLYRDVNALLKGGNDAGE